MQQSGKAARSMAQKETTDYFSPQRRKGRREKQGERRKQKGQNVVM